MFDGFRLDVPDGRASASTRGMFDGLNCQRSARRQSSGGRDVERSHLRRIQALGSAVQRYARAVQDIGRMTEQSLPVLEQQKVAREAQAAGARRCAAATARTISMQRLRVSPALVSEAASGRTANAIRAMQLESEVRTNPELRADRFVQAWQQLERAARQAQRLAERGCARARREAA